MFVAKHFLSGIVDKHDQYPVSTADGGTWYPQACHFLKLKHHIHSFVYKDEKSIIELTMQYIKKIEQKDLMIIFLAKRTNVN
jgi:putative transposase